MAILERKENKGPNSAVYKTDDGTKLRGLVEDDDRGVRFRVPGEDRTVFELPNHAIERIAMSFLAPNRMTFVAGETRHRVRLTGAVIDGEQHGEAGWISGSSPTELEYDRSGRAAEETVILVNGFVRILDWLAADRVRRRRLRDRILARRGGA
jgi:hypothetical protein